MPARRRLAIRVAAAILAGGAAWVTGDFVASGWLASTPFFARDGDHQYACLRDGEPSVAFDVSFRNSSLIATVSVEGRVEDLSFMRGGMAGDLYRGETLTLIIDPEVYLEGYRDRRLGPCDRR